MTGNFTSAQKVKSKNIYYQFADADNYESTTQIAPARECGAAEVNERLKKQAV